jgi:hypothetical protein
MIRHLFFISFIFVDSVDLAGIQPLSSKVPVTIISIETDHLQISNAKTKLDLYLKLTTREFSKCFLRLSLRSLKIGIDHQQNT